MRPLLIVLAGVCASAGTSLAVWVGIRANPPIYCEPIDSGLVRTNAADHQVNLAVAQLMSDTRRPKEDPEQAMIASGYHESADAWFAKPDCFGTTQERASRLVREQTGRDGLPIRIEVIRSEKMPTLVFVEHESRDVRASLVLRLADELARQGVKKI